jgi:phytanoyl-CoA hydroxylase
MGSAQSVQWILNARLLDEDLWSLAVDPRLGELAAQLLRTPSVSLVEDQLLAKPPGGLPVNVHQDFSYWAFSRSSRMVTAWVALVDMTPELGPLQLLQGSHLWGAASRPRELIRGSEDEWLRGVDDVRPPGVALQVHTVQIAAGDAVFFHSLTFHGSPRNESPSWRRAVSLHWAAGECRLDLGATAEHNHPYVFARLRDHGPIANAYMPVVFSRP